VSDGHARNCMNVNEIYDRGSESLTSHSDESKFSAGICMFIVTSHALTQTTYATAYDEVNIENPRHLLRGSRASLRTKATSSFCRMATVSPRAPPSEITTQGVRGKQAY